MALLSMHSAAFLLFLLAVTSVVNLIVKYRCGVRLVRDSPGYRGLGWELGGKISHFFFPLQVNAGVQMLSMWHQKHESYTRFGWEVICNITWQNPVPHFYIADANIISQICLSRTSFPKPTEMYRSLDIYGPNIVSAEGSTWARHRKISSPAFSETMIQLVWEQTYRVVYDMIDSDWSLQGDKVILPRTEVPMKELTLLILMGAAFGRIEDWSPEATHPQGHTMSFRNSLQIILKYFIIYRILPKWIWGPAQTQMTTQVGGVGGRGWLGKVVQETGTAYEELERYLREMVHERQLAGDVDAKRDKRDVFTSLIAATSTEDESAHLTMDEIFGDMFVFLLAGHETTAHTLTFVLGLLALELDEQERLYQHIQTVLGDRELLFDDYKNLDRVMAVFQETMRLFPPVVGIPKTNVEDVHVMINSALSEEDMTDPALEEKRQKQRSLFIPKGSTIFLFLGGLHYNPRYWKDPYTFSPDRFLKPDWPRDAYYPFSAGPRSCLGRKFAEIEAVVVITLIIRRYKVSVDANKFVDIPGESKRDRRYRLLPSTPKVSLTPEGVPLVLTKR
ncbi:hypothetical protein FRB98_002548 [Tulasnella sp. 332]|nr:hypothetical protein FRB98_002548 [Tulasnella sp. 332]